MQAASPRPARPGCRSTQDTPVERLQVCLDDADGVGVLSCERFAPRLAASARPVWTAEALLEPLGAGDTAPRGAVSPDAPAYVIYTSGSTGKPKGILISQRSICHFLRSENAVLGVRADDRVYQGFSVAFDMSFEEIWIAYLVGATLWIGPKEVAGDPETLPRLLAANRVTVLHAVPTLLALFSQDVPSLRLINLGGEMCPESLVERWARPGRQMFNTYGPTEATVSASLARLQPGQPGHDRHAAAELRPAGHRAPTVPTTACALLPRGEMGELCITGPGLAAGYLGRPDLTAEKFLPNPWASGAHDARLYRTGDLARIDADGRGAVPGPRRRPGQDPRLSRRAGRDRGRAGAAARRRHGRGPAAQGRRHRPAGRLPGAGRRRDRRRWRRPRCARRWPTACRRTWCRAATRCWPPCRA